MTNEEAISHIEYSIKAYQNLIENDIRSGEAIGKDIKGEWKSEKTLADVYLKMIESLKMAIKALEQQQYYKDLAESYEKTINKLTKAISEQEPCIENYPTCTECEHYDSEKHYCPRFCQVIKDTLAESQPTSDDEIIKALKAVRTFHNGNYAPQIDEAIRRLTMPKSAYVQVNLSDERIKKAVAEAVEKMKAEIEAQRPKGKWLHPYKSDIACECSVCHIQMPITEYYHFCPNCGSYNGGGEE